MRGDDETRGFPGMEHSLMNADFDADYGDPNRKVIRFVTTREWVGLREGGCSSPAAIEGLTAKMKRPPTQKGGRIPATAVQVRYAKATSMEGRATTGWATVPRTGSTCLEEVAPWRCR